VPPRVSVFLSRYGIIPARRLRHRRRSIKPEDTLHCRNSAENPGVQVRSFSPRSEYLHNPCLNDSAERLPAPQIIKLASGEAPSSTQEMTQQAKIAAALTRAASPNQKVVRRRSPAPKL